MYPMRPDYARHAIRNRLLLSVGLSVMLGVCMTAFVFVVASGTIRSLADKTATLEAMEDAFHAQQLALSKQETFAFDYALSSREEAVEDFDAATEDALQAYFALKAAAGPFPSVLAATEAVHVAATAWREEWAEPFMRSVETGGPTTGEATVEASDALYLPAVEALNDLDVALTEQRQRTAAQIDAAVPDLAFIIVPFGAIVTLLLLLIGVWLTRTISGPLVRLNRTAEALVAGEDVSFTAERRDEVGALADVLERSRVDVGARYDTARRESAHAGTFNQLAELTSFASDEQELVRAAVHAIRRLVPAERGDILLANPSQNRLTVAVAWGTDPPAEGSLVQVDRIDRCPGLRRASAFVADDVADDMAVRCPAHATTGGTLACVPMSALGKLVGVIHLEHSRPRAFDPEMIHLVVRVAETVGLAMANARLMKTMEGQAMTDALTGLRNARFFDPYLQQELQAAERDGETTSVIMLDLDHFKAFNDAYGHPAGDEALRTFARVLGASIRASDVAARYGGEEFIVALRHAGLEDARSVAEKIRLAVEQMVVELGPGRYGRITASLGVASTDHHVADMKSLVTIADAALYRAKEAGRNRVEIAPANEVVMVLAGATRRQRGRAAAGRKPPLSTPA
jgi:diguanylate cyclase (GGDEF)-like protein